jgi:hypothetical protein
MRIRKCNASILAPARRFIPASVKSNNRPRDGARKNLRGQSEVASISLAIASPGRSDTAKTSHDINHLR